MSRTKLFSVTLDDCDVHTFTVGGHGGSGKDTSNTGVRIVHRASGATGQARESRSQYTNKRVAFRRMAESRLFRSWLHIQIARHNGLPSIEEQVEAAMAPENMRVEMRVDGKWVVTT